MAKRKSSAPAPTADPAPTAPESNPETDQAAAIDTRLASYAETIGTSIGRLQNHLDSWNTQRKQLVDQLSTAIGEAQSLLTELGHSASDKVSTLRGAKKPKRYAAPASNPAGALKARKRPHGLTEAQQKSMAAARSPRREPQKAKRVPSR